MAAATVSTNGYIRSHGSAPRGRGCWGFELTADVDYGADVEEIQVEYWAANIPGLTMGNSMTYGEALKLAKAEAKRIGAYHIEVLS
jgi:hypothetical protein